VRMAITEKSSSPVKSTMIVMGRFNAVRTMVLILGFG
jgi:hypothetical protein